jgi:hypothetical protein
MRRGLSPGRVVLAGALAVALLLAGLGQPVRADRDHTGDGDAALLPRPAAIPAAPASFAEARERAAGILRAMHTPATALPALVEAVREAGVTVVAGAEAYTVISGRNSPRQMYLQAGQVLALRHALTADKVVPMSWLTATFAKGTTPQTQALVGDSDIRAYLSAALGQPTDGAELMWKALILGEELPGSDIQATLRGEQPDTRVSPLQLVLLTLRLRADAWQTAVALHRPSARTAQARTTSAFAAAFPCAIDSVPDFVMDAITTATGSFTEYVLPKLKLEKLATIAGMLSWVGTASTLINFALLFVALEIQTRIEPDPLVRTKSTTEAGGTADIVTVVRTRNVSDTPWLRCALRWLAPLGVSADAPAEGGPLPDAPVEWTLPDTRHAAIKNGWQHNVTDESGTARSKGAVVGRTQERDMSRAKFRIQRPLILQTAVDAVAARSLWETVGHYSVIVIQAALAAEGSIPDGVEAAIKILAELASKNGQFAHSTSIWMTDWEDHPVVHVDYEARAVHTQQCDPCTELRGKRAESRHVDVTARARIDVRYPMPGVAETGTDTLRGVDHTYTFDSRYTKVQADCGWTTGWGRGRSLGTTPGQIRATLRLPVDAIGNPVGADLTIEEPMNEDGFHERLFITWHDIEVEPTCHGPRTHTHEPHLMEHTAATLRIHQDLGQLIRIPPQRFHIQKWKMNPNWKVGEEGTIATSTIDHQKSWTSAPDRLYDRLVETITLSTDAR